MKNCPYCAEEIQDEAIVCRYCGRDLLISMKTDVVDSSVMPIETKPSFDEVMTLGNTFPQSWMLSVVQLKEIMDLGSAMVKEVITPIFAKYIEHSVVKKDLVKEEFERVIAQVYAWSFACFGIGVERGVGNLAFEKGMKCIILVSRTYGIHLVYYLGKLIESGVMSRQEAQAHSGFIIGKFLTWGMRIEELGSKEFASIGQKNSDFSRAVKELDKIEIA